MILSIICAYCPLYTLDFRTQKSLDGHLFVSCRITPFIIFHLLTKRGGNSDSHLPSILIIIIHKDVACVNEHPHKQALGKELLQPISLSSQYCGLVRIISGVTSN